MEKVKEKFEDGEMKMEKLELKANDFKIEEISEMPMALRQWGNAGAGP